VEAVIRAMRLAKTHRVTHFVHVPYFFRAYFSLSPSRSHTFPPLSQVLCCFTHTHSSALLS